MRIASRPAKRANSSDASVVLTLRRRRGGAATFRGFRLALARGGSSWWRATLSRAEGFAGSGGAATGPALRRELRARGVDASPRGVAVVAVARSAFPLVRRVARATLGGLSALRGLATLRR